ncbi:MAG TPA: NAD-dependent epimerase/dehydratase family protein [Candidatus Paceibacterota bacterium]|nr:NAD-dependent epimerase/dehydratase family protein [Candidatus Paceibacterota bacterium]
MAQKVVVTGGAGFIGSNLSAELVAKGFEVHIVDRDPAFRRETLPKEAKLHERDIRNTDEMQAIFDGADVVYHTAAVPRVPYSIEHPVETTDENVTGTVSVLTAAARAKVRRVVFSSSGSAYGEQPIPFVETMPSTPVNPYGLQKYVGELFAKMWSEVYGLQTVSLRYFNVYGPGLDPNGPYALAIGKFLLARKTGEPITIFGDGTITRDFTHVDDVVSANILAASSTKVGKGEVLNIGAGRNVSIKALADMFGGEIKYGAPRIEAHDALADTKLAKELIGWEPKVKLEDGIAALKKQWGVA